ncbi:feruloyl esterase b [Fusarium sporotrichioides]|uniref:Carboxylic ester hydrolase n=1 Tax=Fusarium sporotrichioides TaxID=5514 RepID=A0A395RUJ3_FUSSP|nr:feruloyl esterase b [Fusarium sporotrichioides]
MKTQATGTSAGVKHSCDTSNFEFPIIDGTYPTNITAVPTYNYTAHSLSPGSINMSVYTIDFCNVSVTYSHHGASDSVNVQVWLPLPSKWNGRMQAVGGGGYSASFGSLYMTQAVGNGYIALDTNAGHVRGTDSATTPESWALHYPGKVNIQLVNNWGSTSLHEMAVIAKTVSKNYYGKKPRYSYFTGCSGGGRQAMMIAQKYANDFDGLMAAAPAINIENFIPAGYWATQTMIDLEVVPEPCEFEALTQAAIDACDALDGVEDGIISSPALCAFNPQTIVGQTFSCNGTVRHFTKAAASIVQAAWTGPGSGNDRVGWFGLNKDAFLTSTYITTQCSGNGTCVLLSSNLLSSWIQYFSANDPTWNATAMSADEFLSYLDQSEQNYSNSLAADNPDLSAFRKAGGKMITWHGLADEAIPPNGTIAYMEQVLNVNPQSENFIRFYEAPGVGHCYGGTGAPPTNAFSQLVAWVENGTVPTTLEAADAQGRQRELCTFPLRQTYLGGDLRDAASFGCRLTAEKGTPAHELPFYRGYL